VYGNPGLQPLVIVVEDETRSDMERDVVVYDAFGRPMLNESWIGTEHNIDLRTYPSGVYFIAVYEQKAILRTIRVTLMD
jgi:hypothetical protein